MIHSTACSPKYILFSILAFVQRSIVDCILGGTRKIVVYIQKSRVQLGISNEQ